jgi:hypothetical protein
MAVWSRNLISINRTASGAAVDKTFCGRFDVYKFDENGNAEQFQVRAEWVRQFAFVILKKAEQTRSQ